MVLGCLLVVVECSKGLLVVLLVVNSVLGGLVVAANDNGNTGQLRSTMVLKCIIYC